MFWNELKYDDKGLVCGVFQDYQTGEVLIVSWLNAEAVQKTWETKRTHVYRRSRGHVMMKGEVSGNVQIVHEVRVDCDRDALVFKVEQIGAGACAHGYWACFCETVTPEGNLTVTGELTFNPDEVYGEKKE
jgi:phosphoribosyl-AMP cyclohydrolase